MTKEQMEKIGYHEVLLDAYHFLRKYGKVEDNDRFWEVVADDAASIAKKREGTALESLTNGLLSVVYDELERIRKGGENNGKE